MTVSPIDPDGRPGTTPGTVNPGSTERGTIMSKVLVLYYYTWGHVETMARAIAKGAESVPGT